MKYGLTKAQQQIFEMCSYRGEEASAISVGIPILERYDYDVMQQALDELFKRNDALRIKIICEQEKVVQVITDFERVPLEVKNFNTREECVKWAEGVLKKELDMLDCLYYICGYTIGDKCGILFRLHHIISDSWSFYMLLSKLNYYYKCILEGSSIEEEESSYIQYVLEEEKYTNSIKATKDKEYWSEVCSKGIPAAQLSDKPIKDQISKRLELEVPGEVATKIREYCQVENCSMHVFFSVMYGYYIKMIMKESSFFIGTAFVDRRGKEAQSALGMYINVVPMLLQLDSETLSENIKTTKRTLFDIFKHQKYNYTSVVNDLNVKGLCDIVINYQVSYKKLDKDTLEDLIWLYQGAQNEELVIHIVDGLEGSLTIKYDYLLCKYNKNYITYLHEQMLNVIREMFRDIDTYSSITSRGIDAILNEYHSAHKNNQENTISVPMEAFYHSKKEYEDLQIDDLIGQRQYWLNQFSDEIPVLNMMYDLPRPVRQKYIDASEKIVLDKELSSTLKQLANDTKSTEYMVFLSTLMILLGKYSGQSDVIIGAPICGEVHKDVEMNNILPLRGIPKGKKLYTEFLREIKEVCRKAYQNRDYPFEQLVKEVCSKKDVSRNPLFDVMLVWNKKDMDENRPLIDYTATKIDMIFHIEEAADNFTITLNYCMDIFEPESVKRILEHYVVILRQIAVDHKITIDEIGVITDNEKETLLMDWNNTYAEYENEKTIVDLLEKQVERNGKNYALIFNEERLTYEEFNEKVNIVANHLRKIGIEPNDLVAIMTERSLEMLIGIYGILKSGGAYVPIDVSYPQERIQYILEDSKAKALVVYQAPMKDIIQDIRKIDLAEMSEWETNKFNPEKITKPEDLAYCIYTSGTTGKPKGVLVEHHGVVNLQQYCKDVYKINKKDKVLQFAKMIFDASVLEMNMALLNGATLVIADDNTIMNPIVFTEWLAQSEISIAILPPNYYLQVGAIRPRLLMTAGSESNAMILEKSKDLRYINGYGPTEATVFATGWEMSGKEESVIPIGKPIYNTQIYIMQGKSLCGVGVQGELCIGGVGVTRGYLNHDELTNEKFIPNPFGEGRIYCTGDLARFRSDGNIEFLGRIDQQVKIRGYRIELGEIDAVIRSVKGIKDCAVVDTMDSSGDKSLAAYVVSDKKISVFEIRSALKKILPSYMIPSHILQIESLPVTVNGKLDRKALPQIKAASKKTYVAPKDEMEKVLFSICEEVLGIEKFGMNDDFIELGGDSIKVLRITNMLNERGYQVSKKEIFMKLLHGNS